KDERMRQDHITGGAIDFLEVTDGLRQHRLEQVSMRNSLWMVDQHPRGLLVRTTGEDGAAPLRLDIREQTEEEHALPRTVQRVQEVVAVDMPPAVWIIVHRKLTSPGEVDRPQTPFAPAAPPSRAEDLFDRGHQAVGETGHHFRVGEVFLNIIRTGP